MGESERGFLKQWACPACGSGRIRPHREGTYAGRLTRDDVEDYVSAVVANGPVRQGAAVESPK